MQSAQHAVQELKRCKYELGKTEYELFQVNIVTFPKQAFNESLDFCNRS